MDCRRAVCAMESMAIISRDENDVDCQPFTTHKFSRTHIPPRVPVMCVTQPDLTKSKGKGCRFAGQVAPYEWACVFWHKLVCHCSHSVYIYRTLHFRNPRRYKHGNECMIWPIVNQDRTMNRCSLLFHLY